MVGDDERHTSCLALFTLELPSTAVDLGGKPSLEAKCFISQLLLLVYFKLTNYETFIMINSSVFLIYVWVFVHYSCWGGEIC